MNYFNTSQYDDDYWVEQIEKNTPKPISELTGDEVGVISLGLRTPASPEISRIVNTEAIAPIADVSWAYFITVAFPTNHKFKIKHVDLLAQNRSRIVFSPIRYGDCTQNEQYQFINWILNKHVYQLCDKYHIFYEQTREGNIHFHGRLAYDNKKICQKDIRALLHRMFECPTHHKPFVDIKVYDPEKWNNYNNKQTKTYQTVDLPEFKNI